MINNFINTQSLKRQKHNLTLRFDPSNPIFKDPCFKNDLVRCLNRVRIFLFYIKKVEKITIFSPATFAFFEKYFCPCFLRRHEI